MRSRLASQLARVVIVLVTIVAWFVASDHCALAGVLLHRRPRPRRRRNPAPAMSQPEKKQSPERAALLQDARRDDGTGKNHRRVIDASQFVAAAVLSRLISNSFVTHLRAAAA